MGGEDPKYGQKGKFATTSKVLTAFLALVVLSASGLVILKQLSRQRSSGRDDPDLFNEAMISVADDDGPGHQAPAAASVHARETTYGAEKWPVDADHMGKLQSKLEDGSPIGYVRLPQIPKGERTSDDGRLHIIFSSGCNYFQHWQSEFLLASAFLVGQRGRITRIVSGCNDKKAETVAHADQTFPSGKNDLLVPVDQLNRSVNDNFGLFITPMFDGARDFPWINKPSSIQYFMEKARPELDRLGEPFENVIVANEVLNDPGSNKPYIDVVKKGRPVAQRYGLGGGWVSHKYNLNTITGDPDNKAQQWTYQDAAKWTSVGPPMILHVDDITALSVLWEKYMRPVLAVGRDILADMWAYSIGSAMLDLRHTTLDHYMISTWGSHGESFPWVDQWSQLSCSNPVANAGEKSPVFVHMASNFKAPDPDKGPWMFHKGHVPANILDCDTPLLVEAPEDIWSVTSGKQNKQRAWVLCNIVSRLNRVLTMYKQKFCPVGFEQRKLVRLIQSKTKDRGCSERRDKWCFPLAQIEGLALNWRENL